MKTTPQPTQHPESDSGSRHNFQFSILNSKLPLSVALLAVAACSVQPAFATLRSWTGAGTNSNWGTRENWAPAGTPQDGDDLVFPAGAARLVNTNSLVFRRFNSITFNGAGGGYVLRGNGISLSGGISAQNTSGGNTINIIMSLVTADQTFATTTAGGTLAIDANLNLNGHNLTLGVNTATLTLSGVISGTGNLTKTGPGTLTLYGGSPNTYTGSFTVNGGLVQLWKVPGPAVTGALTVSGGATVRSIAADQFSDAGAITLNSGTTLDLNGFNDTVGPITLTAATVQTGSGLLMMGGNITNRVGTNDAFITGRLNLGTATRVFHVDLDPGYDWGLRISASIEGGFKVPRPGITITGGGDLELSGNNTYYGTTTIDDVSHLRLGTDTALGDTLGGTEIKAVFMVVLDGRHIGQENLAIDGLATLKSIGACSWAGDISITTNGSLQLLPNSDGALILSGSISGDGYLLCTGLGEIRLSGTSANTFTGRTTVNDGVNLVLAKPGVTALGGPIRIGSGGYFIEDAVVRLIQPNQIANTASVRILKSGLLLLEGTSSDTIGSLELDSGHVRTETGTLTLNGDVVASSRLEDQPALIAGKLSLGSATRTFHLEQHDPAWLILEVNATISGIGGLTLTGTGQLYLNSSNSYSGLTTVAGEVLRLGHGSALGSTSAGTIVSNGACLYLPGDLSVTDESLILNGPGPTSLYGALRGYALNSWTGPITLASDTTVSAIPTTGILTLAGAIDGPGGLRVVGGGELRLSGTSANTYAGTTRVDIGTLALAKPGLVAVPGPLVIGDGTSGAEADVVRLMQVNQIANTSAVRVNSSGLLLLEGPNSDTIGPLTLEGGRVRTETGTLTLNGDVTARAGNEAQSAQIAGRLSLGSVTRRFHLDRVEPAWIILEVDAAISGTGGLTFTGTGQLNLNSSNSYAGLTTVAGEVLRMGHAYALGSTSAGTIVSNGACLLLPGDISVGAESLTLNGTGPTLLYGSLRSWGDNSWAGPIALASASLIAAYSTNHVLTLSGVISGPGSLTKEGTGTLVLAGPSPNTFTGVTYVNHGTLDLAKSSGNAIRGQLIIGDNVGAANSEVVRFLANNQLDAATVQVIVNSSGLLDLNGFNQTLGNLTLNGGGDVQTGAGTLTLNALSPVLVEPGSVMDASAQISGKLNVGSGQRRFLVGQGLYTGGNLSDLLISAVVSGTAEIIKEGDGELELDAANTFTGPMTISVGAVRISHDEALGATGSGTVVNAGAYLQLHRGSLQVGAEPLTLNGRGPFAEPRSAALYNPSGSNGWAGNITLATDTTVSVGFGDYGFLNLSGVISGPGGLTKADTGTLILSGSAANTYAGATLLNEGTLSLSKAVGNAVPGPGGLIVGDDIGDPQADVVRLTQHTQIGVLPVTIRQAGKLDLNNFDDAIGALTFEGGRLSTGNGTLILGGDVTVLTNTQTAFMLGKVSLGASPRTFAVSDAWLEHAELEVYASLLGTGGLIKTGEGGLRLRGSNSYSGLTIIQQGFLDVSDPDALGTADSGTVVSNGASLLVVWDTHIVNESLTLNGGGFNSYGPLSSYDGSNSWSGPITLAEDSTVWAHSSNVVLNLRGPISGPGGLTKRGYGTVALSGANANTYAGATRLVQGTLVLAKSVLNGAIPGDLVVGDGSGGAGADLVQIAGPASQIANTGAVTVAESGLLQLLVTETFGSLAGSGAVDMGGRPLRTGLNNQSTIFSGIIRGTESAWFEKDGTGTLALTGTNTYTGPTRIYDGTLLINGVQPDSGVTVFAPGTLGGTGTVGAITAVGGSISPGTSPGTLTSSNVVLNSASAFDAELSGTGHDRLNARGSVALGDATLALSTAGLVPAEGDQFIILHNDSTDAVAGTFAGLSEGALVTGGPFTFRLSYAGGDGNDVVLTVTDLALQAAGWTISSGNGNGVVDRDECNLLDLVLSNAASGPVTIDIAQLAIDTPGVFLSQGISTYPTLAAGGTAANLFPFQFLTTPTLACGAPLALTLQVTAQGHGTFRIPFALPTGSPGTPTRLDNHTPLVVGDLGHGESTVLVSRFLGRLARVNVSCHLTHSNANDLDLYLEAPDGTRVELSTGNGKGADYGRSCLDRDRTVFDDAAKDPITAGATPFVGSYRPESPLAALRGDTPNGTWTLVVEDDTANGQSGTLNCWSLFLYPAECAAGGGPCELCPDRFTVDGALESSDPTQAGQLNFTGVSSRCGLFKIPPARHDALPRRYDAYTFAHGPGTACITVGLATACGDDLYCAAYRGQFDPANPTQHYLADGGGSGARTYSFNVGADTTFVVVVSEAVTNAACTSYTLSVSGGACRPVLHIAPAGPNRMVLDWTSAAVGYQLERADSLGAHAFRPAPGLPVVVNRQFTMTNTLAGTNRFYRLHKP